MAGSIILEAEEALFDTKSHRSLKRIIYIYSHPRKMRDAWDPLEELESSRSLSVFIDEIIGQHIANLYPLDVSTGCS